MNGVLQAPRGAGWLYVRISPDDYTAELFDAEVLRRIEREVYYNELVHNGNGEERDRRVGDLAAIGALQSV